MSVTKAWRKLFIDAVVWFSRGTKANGGEIFHRSYASRSFRIKRLVNIDLRSSRREDRFVICAPRVAPVDSCNLYRTYVHCSYSKPFLDAGITDAALNQCAPRNFIDKKGYVRVYVCIQPNARTRVSLSLFFCFFFFVLSRLFLLLVISSFELEWRLIKGNSYIEFYVELRNFGENVTIEMFVETTRFF